MRKTSKLLSLVLAVLMMLSIVSVSASAQYTDVSVDDTALNDAVNLLTTLGVAYGTTETTFAPDENVTRQQMAAFIYRLMKAGKQVTGGNNTSGFADLDDSTFYYMVSWTAENGIIKGTSATTFNPKGGITLQDAYVMLVRALGYEKDTTLPYPIGFIDVAEDLGLDEDLPSTLQYTDTLTRGQVAILLANAFYADMNEVTTEYEWKSNGVADANGDFTYAYVPVETVETIAHKIFGVVEETFEVFATKHYAYNGYQAQYSERNDIDYVVGVRTDKNDAIVNGTTEVIKLADLGLSGSSDDYFMAELTLFVKKDGTKAADDKFLAAKSNLIKKTVAASDVVLETSTKTDKEYYVGGVKNKTADKVMTGYITFGTTKAYIDNAPYSYTTVDNKDYVKFIKMTSGSYADDGNSVFNYADMRYGTNGSYQGYYADTTNSANNSHDYLTTEFANDFEYIYNNGLYEVDVYDVDGDGYAEYVMPKAFTAAEVEVKKSTSYAGLKANGTKDVKKFNTKDAVIVGSYADEDIVLGYFPGASIPYVEIKEVLKPITATVVATTNGTDSITSTLSTGEVIEYKDADKRVANYAYTADTLILTAGKTYVVYVKDGVLLCKDGLSSEGFDSEANYAIIVKNSEASAPNHYVSKMSGVVNGEYKNYYYVKAIMGGALKAVKLSEYAYSHYELTTADVIDTTVGTNGKKADVESVKINNAQRAEQIIGSADFANVFSTYTVDDESGYVFTALDIKTNDKTIFADTAKENSVYYNALGNITLAHYTGNIFSITAGSSVDLGTMSRFNVKDYSKVIIKSYDDDNDAVYTEYTVDTLPKFDATNFVNAQAIFVNNKTSNIENLGILYAEMPAGKDFTFKAAQDYRIVIDTATKYENEKNVAYVTVLDPKTATTTQLKADTGYASPAKYDLVVITEDGKAKKSASVATKYEENDFVKGQLKANYDADNKFLDLGLKSNESTPVDVLFTVDENTTILYFTAYNDYELTDTDILYLGEDNGVIDDLKNTENLSVYVVAEDGDNYKEDHIAVAKTLIVVVDGRGNAIVGK